MRFAFQDKKNQEEFFTKIIDAISYPFYVVDVKNYSVVAANTAALTGRSLKNLKCYQLSHKRNFPCRGTKHMCPLTEIKKTGLPAVFEHIHYDSRGEERIVEVYASPIFNSRGELTHIVEYNLDITNKKKIQDDLRKNEERFRAVFENALDAICLKDKNLCYTHINNMAEKLLGKPASEVIGKNDFDIFPHSEAEQMKIMDKRVLFGEVIKEESAHIINDRLFFFYTVIMPIKDLEGKINGICCFSHDITKSKQAEHAIKKERDLARKYLDIAGTMIIVLAPNQKVELINKKGCEILGYAEEEIVGENWFDVFVPKKIIMEIKEKFNKFVNGRGNFKYCECPVLTKNGEEKIVAWNNILIKDDAGKVEGVLCSGEDITLKKKSEEELKRRNKDLERFNKLMVGRELKMIELKKKIKKLEKQIKNMSTQ